MAVPGVPCHLCGTKERERVALELVRGEVGVVLGRLRGGGPHLPVALAQLAPVAERVDRQVEKEHAEQAEHHDRHERVALAAARRAATEAPATSAAAPAEPGASGPGLSENQR